MTVERPGCYGFPTAVSASSPSCRVCPFRSGCVYEAFSLLEMLPNNPLTQSERLSLCVTRIALMGLPPTLLGATPSPVVVEISRGRPRLALSVTQLDQINRLPARVGDQVRQLASQGWFEFAKSELKRGRNPALKGWKRVFCALLLQGGGSRATLQLALTEQLKLTPSSAKVQVSVGIAIFAAGRVATEQFGRVVLLPN